jgi:hypothetical protein
MVVVKKIGLMSIAKIQALVWMVSGLILAVVQAVWFSFSPPQAAAFAGVSASEVYWGILIVPLSWAVFGFLMGMLFGWIYNLFSSWIGGVELELEEKIPKQELHLRRGRR